MSPSQKNKLLKLIATTPGVMKIGPVYATSGAVVPVIPDFRKLYSNPKVLKFLGSLFAQEVKRQKVSMVAGMETAGIPIASIASVISGVPMVIMRKKPHKGWNKSIIDGAYKKGQATAIIDDAITFGGQKARAGKRARRELKIQVLIVIWDSRYPSRFREKLSFKLVAFVTKLEVMDYMKKRGLMGQDTYEVMLAQTKNPWHWQKDMKMWNKLLAIKKRGIL